MLQPILVTLIIATADSVDLDEYVHIMIDDCCDVLSFFTCALDHGFTGHYSVCLLF